MSRSTYCLDHTRSRDKARGSAAERGYDRDHQKMRKRLDRIVQTGTVRCPCGELIAAGSPWDLGHTPDRRGYIGPMHAHCNRATARKAA